MLSNAKLDWLDRRVGSGDLDPHLPARSCKTVGASTMHWAGVVKRGAWGREYARDIESYRNVAGLWIIGEDLSQHGNAVTLDATVRDQHGLPVAHVHHVDHPNDAAIRKRAWQVSTALYEAAGARKVYTRGPFPRPPTWVPVGRVQIRARVSATNTDRPTMFAICSSRMAASSQVVRLKIRRSQSSHWQFDRPITLQAG